MKPSDLPPDQAYIAAQDFAASGRYGEAIEAYSAAIRDDLCHVSGEHLNALGDLDIVISSYSDWPSVFVAYYDRAVSRLALGRNIEAIEDCDEAIRRKPKYVAALYLRGAAWKALGHFITKRIWFEDNYTICCSTWTKPLGI
jgi:tetratricopeptide (TPR) repeat protein